MQLRGEYVSLRRLSGVLVERGIRLTKSSLARLVKKLGFRFYKSGSDRRYIGERNDIVSMRHTYLRSIRNFREAGRPIVYLDETWLNTNHVARGDWVDCPRTSTSAFESHRGGHGRFVPPGKGSRLIIVDAGSSAVGMIPGSCLMFESKTGTHDYHDEMNSGNFTRWFTEQLLPNLPGNSVIVMDNASYHSHLDPESKCPTSSARKAEIQSWLDRKGIHYTPAMIKAELLTLVKQHKPRPKYVIDDLASQAGHTVLRLPPYHCELNPIELVWAELKSFVARSNTTFKKDKVMELFNQARSAYDVEKWRRVESHVINEVETKLWKLDGVQDDEVAPVIIDLTDSEDSDSDLDTDSGDDENDVDSDVSMNSVEESDDEVTCCICGDYNAPGRSRKIAWVECELCERWSHRICTKPSLKSGGPVCN
ncbi:uncharacterized protein LOC133199989 [Saccostrea echinata]|uniref:uncharacterized protein LOC133177070 n=1 Tax=Saccostrea echinata TaxID=191078 RepID=UPI002A8218FA|nr:uncharacterized protein LOC133177070 [Saccostrea echinata]XP_061191749.1 uncharacterized protein LOC133199989 [Saccostrea echinata]